MKRFSQFHQINGGNTRFKQAPNAVLIQQSDNNDDPKKITFVITGDETFTFSSANSAMYFMNTDMSNVMKSDIISAECTHFTYGSGNVLAEMKDDEFIFNITAATGLTTGNVSFKKTGTFTSKDTGIAWFKEQYAKGTPVTITVNVKQTK